MLKFQRILLGLFILMIPIVYPLNNAVNMRDFQQSIFQYGVMIVAVFFVRNIWLALFFCYSLFLYWLNGSPVGHETILNIFLGIMLFGVSRQLYSKFKFDKECRWILAVGTISMIFMVLQFLKIDPLHSSMTGDGIVERFKDFNDPVGIFSLKAHNGIFLALLVPIMTMFHPLLGMLMFLPIKFCDSSGAMLAAGVSILFYLWFDKRNIFPEKWNPPFNFRWFYLVLIVGILGSGLFFYKDYKSGPKMYGSRFNIWHLTFRQSLLRPIGYGPDSFRNLTKYKNFMIMGDQDFHSAIGFPVDKDHYQFIYYEPRQGKMAEINTGKDKYELNSPNIWDHPHNEYLNLLFCFGFISLVILGFQIKDLGLRFYLSDKNPEIMILSSMILVFMFGALVQFPFSVARLGYIFPLILGAFYASTEKKYAIS